MKWCSYGGMRVDILNKQITPTVGSPNAGRGRHVIIKPLSFVEY